MKRISLLTILIVALTTTSFAQKNTFNKGEQVINLGIGIGNAYYDGNYTSKIVPLSISYEMGIIDNLFDDKSSIGVGGFIGFTGAKNKLGTYLGDEYGYKYRSFVLGPRGYFHYQLVEKLDTYAGIMLGYNIVSAKEYGNFPNQYESNGSSIAWSGFIGARYYFSDNIAVMAEMGYGVAYLNLGVALKF